MIKSVLAVSEGGPDAAMSFRLAARVAAQFDGAVDALHLPVGPAGGMMGGLAMSGEAMPLVMDLDDDRLEARAKESGRAYQELLDPIKGERAKAYVVLQRGATLTAEALEAHGRERLATYKVPRLYEFITELPKNPAGKILKRALRDRVPV